jgi:predicted nucleotide-binding protein (sugar kinase/HSP70/actin superfamily)
LSAKLWWVCEPLKITHGHLHQLLHNKQRVIHFGLDCKTAIIP